MRLKKGLVSRCWENLILAMLGEQFMVGDELCGSVVSTRLKVNVLTINCWFVRVEARNLSTRFRLGGENLIDIFIFCQKSISEVFYILLK